MARTASKKGTAKKTRGGKTRGSWKKGQSGNPTGRKPDKELAILRKEAREVFGPYAKEAVNTIVELMKSSSVDKVRLAAADLIATRVWGKAPEKVELTGADGKDLLAPSPRAELLALFGEVLTKGLQKDS